MPRDNRSPLTPDHCKSILEDHPEISIVVQPSAHRCFSETEFANAGCIISEQIESCAVFLGVKEVPIAELLEGKTYFFFSHTIKKQSHNRSLLQSLITKNIRMIDYECLVDDTGRRLIGFGYFAGIVGAYNGLQAYGIRTGSYTLKPATSFKNLAEIIETYKDLRLPAIKIVLTGGGKVARGAKEVLKLFRIEEKTKDEFLKQEFDTAVFCQLENEELYKPIDGEHYDRDTFYHHPENYYCDFEDIANKADLMINGIYWASNNPKYFTQAEMADPRFHIKVIADITCDISPEASVPSTLRATKIGDPVMGYDPMTGQETDAFNPNGITVMSIDNLPNELPRDASGEFSRVFYQRIIPELFLEKSNILDEATICDKGKLLPKFEYLTDFIKNLQ